jgi:hypothetical protein
MGSSRRSRHAQVNGGTSWRHTTRRSALPSSMSSLRSRSAASRQPSCRTRRPWTSPSFRESPANSTSLRRRFSCQRRDQAQTGVFVRLRRPERKSFGNRKSLARSLGLEPAALGPGDLPPQVVSTGTPHLLVPVVPSALAKLRPDEQRLRGILAGAGAQGCYVFAPTPGQRTAATARFFSPAAGIPEDPATASAAGPLACYLRYYGILEDQIVRFAQGAETGRPSELEIELRADDVIVRGRAVVVAEGLLHLPPPNAGRRESAAAPEASAIR